MKSLTAVCQTGASMPAINPNGRVARHPHQRGDGENAEMKMYLSKLKDLVPFMPKNRKLSKLEIIQHVIDYICDLQSELETHPEIGSFDAASALNFVAQNSQNDSMEEDTLSERLTATDATEEQQQQQQQQQLLQQQQQLQYAQQQQQQHSSPATRQPLVDRQTPNTILPANSATGSQAAAAVAAAQLQQYQQQHLQQQPLLVTAQSSQAALAEKDNNSSSSSSRQQQSPC